MLRIAIAAFLLTSCATAQPRAEAPAPVTCAYTAHTAEARYSNGDVALAAAWITPAGARNMPAIVIVQGSGTSDRSNAWAAMIANSFVRCGVAVLLTDKRGSGASGGSWRDASLFDLAGDAAAGLNWVAQQQGVDRGRVGFLGLSQGGQVAPAAAVQAREADFVVGWVTSVGPLKDTLLYELEQTYRQHNVPPPAIDGLQEMARASFVWLETGQGWDRYLAARAQFVGGPFERAVETWPTEQSDPYWTFWRLNGSYDPLPYWTSVVRERRLQALVVLGEDDARDNVDVATTSRRLRETLGDDISLEVLPGVGHSLQTAPDQIHPRAMEATLAAVRDANRRR